MSKGLLIAIIAGIVIAAVVAIGIATTMPAANPGDSGPDNDGGNIPTPTGGKNYTVNLNEEIKFREQ
ncbi:hypothetical protein [Candidatus Nitrososphaera gargensis]|uniref:hypothetical protein n=1 Tax=Candidatus Nitrososphaera gargensis TaxID=497727 RepID=UPI0011E57648|nr:hypothetical protein [Candidatus Nitrososphaera gargensis]